MTDRSETVDRPKTRRLYYEDCFKKEFTATVTGIGSDDRGAYLVLDATLFFPEGGGQPADRGFLNGIAVCDVQVEEDEIRHYVKDAAAVQTGDAVEGKIDWERRFDLMQQHSGEHIVSGWIHARFGYDNVGFHMGEELITIDLNGELSALQLAQVEEEVNRYIWRDEPVKDFLASEEEIRTLPYRSKLALSGEVRLIEFPGADLCACCGLHVARTGQIGLIKLISVHRFRQGVRIEMVSGRRAFAYLNAQHEQNSRIAVELSAKPAETFGAVEKLKEENFRLRGDILRLEKEKYERIAEQCRDAGNVFVYVPGMSPVDIRKCADQILDVCGGICVFLSGDEEQGFKYAVGEREGDIRELVKEMNQRLAGRGGGKPFFAQGSFKGDLGQAETFFRERDFVVIL